MYPSDNTKTMCNVKGVACSDEPTENLRRLYSEFYLIV